MRRSHRLIQQPQSTGIGIPRERSLHRGQKTAQRSERIVHRRSFIPAVHHAIRAMRIARLRPVVGPLGLTNQLIESFGVAILKQVTRLLPARSEEHTSELQSRGHLVCRLLLEKKKKK